MEPKEKSEYPVAKVLLFSLDYAKDIFEEEKRREASIISQANSMQTVFAVITAALFIVAQIAFDYPKPLSRTYLFVVFSVIAVVLLFSLFAATMAQNRKTQAKHSMIDDFRRQVNNESEKFRTEAQRAKYLFELYTKLHESLEINNNWRIEWVKVSMWSFYAALILCVILFSISAIMVF